MTTDPLHETLRTEGGRVLATLIRLTGDIDLAEDALQDAVVIALDRWPADGHPDNPAAWLTTVARRAALDRIRRETKRVDKEQAATLLLDDPLAPATRGHDSMIADDLLRLLFTCCHPALSPEARLALALRTLGGMTTPEIAAAFLVPEATIGQRISRAKRKIATAGIPYRVPADHELPGRLADVLATIYLVYTSGHHPSHGSLVGRVDLAAEAIRLARLVVELMPAEPEADGLLALLLATDARRATRADESGELVLLVDQDRTRWDHRAIAEAAALVERTLRRGRPGPYQIQAAIAALHGLGASFATTDWPQIAQLYAVLEHFQPTPVVRVNRAVAVGEAEGPGAGLALLDELGCPPPDPLARWHLYWATRAELLRRLDLYAEARAAFERAVACPANDADRRFLLRRLEEFAER